MLKEKHLQKILTISLGTSPEKMLENSLEICVELAGGNTGSILGEEGPSLQFLFSDAKELIGVQVPFDSIAGMTVNKNLVIYTYAPKDKRHFAGVDRKTQKQTNYLLSIPIPSVHVTGTEKREIKNAGALQILFNENIFPNIDISEEAQEFEVKEFKNSALYNDDLKNVFFLLPIISFGMEVMSLRKTSYQVIHELKNKMISSLSWMEYLKTDINGINTEVMEDEDIIEDFNLATTAVEEGAELAKNYLQFTKLYTPVFEQCNINNILQDSAASIKALGLDLGIQDFSIKLNLDETIKDEELDNGKLKMAFFNLCKNAVEALHTFKTEKPEITFSTSVEEDNIVISIADNGPGMPKEIADNLFIPFKTKKEGGTGLGLTITKKIVDLHSGRIECKTSKSGTKFIINIPLTNKK